MRNTLKISIFLSCLLATLQSYAETDVKQVVSFNNMILLDGVDLNKGFIYPSTGGKQIKEIIAYPSYYRNKGDLADNPLATFAVKSINNIVQTNQKSIKAEIKNGVSSLLGDNADYFPNIADRLPDMLQTRVDILVKQEKVVDESSLNNESKKADFVDVSECRFDRHGAVIFYRSRYWYSFDKNKEVVVKTISQLSNKNWVNREKSDTRDYCSLFKVNTDTGLIEQEIEIDCLSREKLKELNTYSIEQGKLYRKKNNDLGSSSAEINVETLVFDEQNHLFKMSYSYPYKGGTIDCIFSEINEQGDWLRKECSKRLFTVSSPGLVAPTSLYRKIEYYDNE